MLSFYGLSLSDDQFYLPDDFCISFLPVGITLVFFDFEEALLIPVGPAAFCLLLVLGGVVAVDCPTFELLTPAGLEDLAVVVFVFLRALAFEILLCPAAALFGELATVLD